MQNLFSFNRLKTCKSPNQRLLLSIYLQHVQTNLAIEIDSMFLILETAKASERLLMDLKVRLLSTKALQCLVYQSLYLTVRFLLVNLWKTVQ